MRHQTGYLYVLSNPSMIGMIKIGVTSGSPEERASSMGMNTGVPTPFNLEWSKKVRSIYKVERAIHGKMAKNRVNKGREFFIATMDDFYSAYIEVMDEQMDIVAI